YQALMQKLLKLWVACELRGAPLRSSLAAFGDFPLALLPLEAQGVITDSHLVCRGQLAARGESDSIEVGAVGRLQILHHQAIANRSNPGVDLGDVTRRKHQIVVLSPANL